MRVLFYGQKTVPRIRGALGSIPLGDRFLKYSFLVVDFLLKSSKIDLIRTHLRDNDSSSFVVRLVAIPHSYLNLEDFVLEFYRRVTRKKRPTRKTTMEFITGGFHLPKIALRSSSRRIEIERPDANSGSKCSLRETDETGEELAAALPPTHI